MENISDFERFVVQYWGQVVGKLEWRQGCIPAEPIVEIDTLSLTSFDDPIVCLSLRSIDSLTKPELIHIGTLLGWQADHFKRPDFILREKARTWVTWPEDQTGNRTEPYLSLRVFDYLRSIGVLVPFANYSIEKLLSLGWVVIKEQ